MKREIFCLSLDKGLFKTLGLNRSDPDLGLGQILSIKTFRYKNGSIEMLSRKCKKFRFDFSGQE